MQRIERGPVASREHGSRARTLLVLVVLFGMGIVLCGFPPPAVSRSGVVPARSDPATAGRSAGDLLSLGGASRLRPGARTASALVHRTGRQWIGADGGRLPFASEEEVLEFLRTASVVLVVGQIGLTSGTRKILLERDGVRAHAAFRQLDERETRRRYRGRTHPFFRDSFLFECAAYELSRLLGIDAVPPTVLRSVHGRRGSAQLWLEGVITEDERERRGLAPPDRVAWSRQWDQMELFDQLVFNLDRNQQNLLIDSDWKIWLVDHSLAFRRYGYLEDIDDVAQIERGVWERLQRLDGAVVDSHLGPYLEEAELQGLLERIELARAHFQALIEQRGEATVVYERTGS